MPGEIKVKDHDLSQACSSIEVRHTMRDGGQTDSARRAAALIPGFVSNKVDEMVSDENAASSQERFGTGDFPD